MGVYCGEISWGNNRPVLYRMDMVEILQKKVLLLCNEDAMLCRREASHRNEMEAPGPPVNSKWFEMLTQVRSSS